MHDWGYFTYYDMESVVYIGNGDKIPRGVMHGEWREELDNDDYIIECLSTGPKICYFKTQG